MSTAMVERPVLAMALLLTAVLASSLLGLTRPMVDEPVEDGFQVFPDVWKASVWGDRRLR